MNSQMPSAASISRIAQDSGTSLMVDIYLMNTGFQSVHLYFNTWYSDKASFVLVLDWSMNCLLHKSTLFEVRNLFLIGPLIDGVYTTCLKSWNQYSISTFSFLVQQIQELTWLHRLITSLDHIAWLHQPQTSLSFVVSCIWRANILSKMVHASSII